jgi:hypothetical protein
MRLSQLESQSLTEVGPESEVMALGDGQGMLLGWETSLLISKTEMIAACFDTLSFQ